MTTLPALRGGATPERSRLAAGALAAAGLGLGVALLGPRLLPDTDPMGVDPHSLRLSVLALGLVAVALARRTLRPALPVFLAVLAVVVPFTLWSSTPDVIFRTAGDRVGYRPAVLAADTVYLLAALALGAVAVHRTGEGWLAGLRLGGRAALRAVPATALVLVAIVVVFLAVPATLLGRVALPLSVLARDLPLLGPAYCLQAAAQEIAFRGALQRVLEQDLGPWPAIVGQSLLFGLAHIAVQYEGPAAPIIPVTVGLGLGFGWVTWRTGSLLPVIVAHAVLEVGQAYGVLPGLYGA